MNDTRAQTPAPLALRPREMAKALGVSERTLWELTNRREIPFVKIGRCVVYPTDLAREWLAANAEGGER